MEPGQDAVEGIAQALDGGGLAPVAAEDEGSPVVGVGILGPHVKLSLAQRLRFLHSVLQIGVEALHQRRRRSVVHAPQGLDHAGCASVEESSRKANYVVSSTQFTEFCLTRTQHNEIDVT